MQSLKNIPFADIEKARQIRNKRSVLKQKMKKGEITVKDVFSSKEMYFECFANMRVIEFVSALPGYGPVIASRLMDELKINKCKKLKGLGRRQSRDFFKFFNITEHY